MENIKIILDGVQKDVYGLFYIFNSKYYFIYTEKEVDENDYVILYMSQIGKETKNTETGPVDTGYMVGVEVSNPEEQQNAQASISYIVEDKKNNTINPLIQYLPMSMLTNLKIISKKRFRLLKSVMMENFKLQFESSQEMESLEDSSSKIEVPLGEVDPVQEQTNLENNDSDVIIDYRSKYFEIEEKNKELQVQITELRQKLDDIKKVIE
jgi:hypothetical protein